MRAVSAVVCVLFLAWFVPGSVHAQTTRPAVPSPGVESAAATATLKIVTYNVRQCGRNIDKISDCLRRENADIVFLQEVRRADPEKHLPGQAEEIARSLGGCFVVSGDSLNLPVAQSCDVAILSKRKLDEGGVRTVEQGGHAYAIYAQMRVDGRDLHLMSVHTQSTSRLQSDHMIKTMNRRLAQVQGIIDFVAQVSGDVIVAGDFNAAAWMPEYRGLTRVLTDFGLAIKATEPTFPAWRPATRIDYVFGRGHLTPQSCSVRDVRWSDHRPVVVVLDWEPKAPAEPQTHDADAKPSRHSPEGRGRDRSGHHQGPTRKTLERTSAGESPASL